jgi:hypothetical protein
MSALLVFIKVYRQSVSQFPLHAIFKKSRQLGFGVFIVIWSMLYLILHVNLHNVVLDGVGSTSTSTPHPTLLLASAGKAFSCHTKKVAITVALADGGVEAGADFSYIKTCPF